MSLATLNLLQDVIREGSENVKIVCSSDSSWAVAEVKYRGECGVRVKPSRDTIFRLVKRFQKTGIACDERTEGRRRGQCVST